MVDHFQMYDLDTYNRLLFYIYFNLKFIFFDLVVSEQR